jgi:hypothetical protein
VTNAVNLSTAAATGFLRNRIINGAMVIDQRNAGASGTANGYTVDRWSYYSSQASKLTWQQNAGSVTPPVGFTNYLGFTSSSAYSVISSDRFLVYQPIEGYNVSDLAWGSANAATVTVSFWVRSSLTGNFGASLQNPGSTRSYPFSFAISSANTWEKKSISVPGCTDGTWGTSNGVGIYIAIGLGTGSTSQGTANTWLSGLYDVPTGSVSLVGTNGATFYITGVQLEVGTVATPFEREIYSNTLAKCQRYYQLFGGAVNNFGVQGYNLAGNNCSYGYSWIVPMRATPTVTLPTMSNTNTVGLVANNPNQYGVLFAATATANGAVSSLNLAGGTGSASAEL